MLLIYILDEIFQQNYQTINSLLWFDGSFSVHFDRSCVHNINSVYMSSINNTAHLNNAFSRVHRTLTYLAVVFNKLFYSQQWTSIDGKFQLDKCFQSLKQHFLTRSGLFVASNRLVNVSEYNNKIPENLSTTLVNWISHRQQIGNGKKKLKPKQFCYDAWNQYNIPKNYTLLIFCIHFVWMWQ